MLHSGILGMMEGPSFEAETAEYVARLPTKPSLLQQVALNRFIHRGKNAGWWDDHTTLNILGQGAADSAVINLKGSSFSATLVNSPLHVPYVGVKFDGTSTWLNPNIAWASINDASIGQHGMWVYLVQGRTGLGFPIGATSTGVEIALRPRNNKIAQFFDGDTTPFPVNVASAIGFTGLFRNNMGKFVGNRQGSEATFSKLIASFPTVNPAVGRLGVSGSTYDPSFVFAYGFIGGQRTLRSANARADLAAALDELALAYGALTVDDLYPDPEFIGPNCWEPGDMALVTPVGMKVTQQFPPPIDSDTSLTYPAFPLTDAATTRFDYLVAGTWTQGNGWGWTWCNRSTELKILGGNPLFPPIRTTMLYNGATLLCFREYTTIAKADAATLSEVAYHCGKLAHEADGVSGYLDIINAAGMADSDWISYAAAAASPDAIFTQTPANGGFQKCTRDKVIGPVAKLHDAPANLRTGLLLDFEVADLRSSAQTRFTLAKASTMLRLAGLQSNLYLNQLTGGNATNEGINDATTMQFLATKFDRITGFVAWTNNSEHDIETSIINQLALFGPTVPTNIEAVVGIGPYGGQLTDEDCAVIRSFIDGTHPAMGGQTIGFVNFWRYYGTVGGSKDRQYNQIIAIVLGLPRV